MVSTEPVLCTSNSHRLILWATGVCTLVAVVLLMVASELQYPTYARSGSGIRISSVACPNVFYPLAWSHVCLAAILLAKAQWNYLKRLTLVVGTVWIWSSVIERYAALQFEQTAARFMMAGSVIYLGLSMGSQRGPGKPRLQATVRSLRQISIGQLFVMTAWIALWIVLEHQHVRRIGLTSVVRFYVSNSIPFAVLSLALVWAVNAEQSKATSVPVSAKLIIRILMAIGMAVGFSVLAMCLNSVVTMILLGDRHVVWTAFLSRTMDGILLTSMGIAICGFMIVPWLVVARLPSRQAPQRGDLKRPM